MGMFKRVFRIILELYRLTSKRFCLKNSILAVATPILISAQKSLEKSWRALMIFNFQNSKIFFWHIQMS
jgi:hypothetical protein